MEIVAAHLIHNHISKHEVRYCVLLKENEEMLIKNVVVKFQNLLDPDAKIKEIIKDYEIENVETEHPLNDYLNMMIDSVFVNLGKSYTETSLFVDYEEGNISDEEIKHIDVLVYVLALNEPYTAYIYPGWSFGINGEDNIIDNYVFVNVKQGYSDVVDFLWKAKDIAKSNDKTIVFITDKYCVKHKEMDPAKGFSSLQTIQEI